MYKNDDQVLNAMLYTCNVCINIPVSWPNKAYRHAQAHATKQHSNFNGQIKRYAEGHATKQVYPQRACLLCAQ